MESLDEVFGSQSGDIGGIYGKGYFKRHILRWFYLSLLMMERQNILQKMFYFKVTKETRVPGWNLPFLGGYKVVRYDGHRESARI